MKIRDWGLGRAAVCDCGTPWTFLLLFFTNVALCVLSMRVLYGNVRVIHGDF